MGIGRSRNTYEQPTPTPRPADLSRPGMSLGLSSWFVIVQNLIGLLLSVPVLVNGILLSVHDNECGTFMDKPIITVGALLMFVSLLGICLAVISHGKTDALRRNWAQLVIMFCLVVLLFCFAIFSLEITNEDLAHHVTTSNGQIVTEYRLYEYPKWMRHRVDPPSKWANIKNCLIRKKICEKIVGTELTPTQGGCCKPPSACNITYGELSPQRQAPSKMNITKTNDVVNKETWVVTPLDTSETWNSQEVDTVDADVLHIMNNMTSAYDTKEDNEGILSKTIRAYVHDCKNWSNQPDQLCFDCDTCKAGLIQSSMDHWHKSGTLYVVLVIIMIVQYALFACYGFKDQMSNVAD